MAHFAEIAFMSTAGWLAQLSLGFGLFDNGCPRSLSLLAVGKHDHVYVLHPGVVSTSLAGQPFI
jgi:hypothetical protein